MSAADHSSRETADLVLIHLADQGNVVAASVRQIAEACGIGRNTAHTAIRRLLAEERISVERLGTGDGYGTRYRLLGHPDFDPEWASRPDVASEFEAWEPTGAERAAGETPAAKAVRESIMRGLKDAHEGRVARRDDLFEDD